MRPLALCLVVALLLAGCDSGLEPPVPEPPADPAFSLVLRPFAGRQRALLTPVRPADDEEARHGRERLLQSAEVRVGGVRFHNRPVDSVRLDGGPTRNYNYYADSLGVKTGRTYDLRVRLGDGRTVEGQATVPGVFEGDAEGLRIFWRESAEAARYRVTVEAGEGNPGDFYTQQVVRDTSLTVHPDEDFAEGRHYVTVEALGANLSAFLLDETSRAGLEGAVGVFGAATTIAGPVTLEREDGPSSGAAPATGSRRALQRRGERPRNTFDLQLLNVHP